MNILEPQEMLRRIKLSREALEHQKKAISPKIAKLSGDLALHNIQIAEEKAKALISGMDGMVMTYRVGKETEPLKPLEN